MNRTREQACACMVPMPAVRGSRGHAQQHRGTDLISTAIVCMERLRMWTHIAERGPEPRHRQLEL